MLIYSFLLRIYLSGIFFFSLFNFKARKWIKGRKGLKSKILELGKRNAKFCWFHCSSYGEFQDAKCFIDDFRNYFPGFKILLTFFSPTGFENVSGNYPKADEIIYLPIDTKANASFFISTIRPGMAFFIRNDVWPNYLHELERRKIPTYLLTFTLNEKSRFLKYPQKSIYKKAFWKYDIIFVHDMKSKEILEKRGYSRNIVHSGNARIDRVVKIYKEDAVLESIKRFSGQAFRVIAGSAEKRDKKIFLKTYSQLRHLPVKWIYVPHEIHQKEIKKFKSLFPGDVILYSELKDSHDGKLLFVDMVGILSKIYKYSDLAFIGGGYSEMGIHSILEPAVFGNAICFGPNHREYSEALDLIEMGGARVVKNHSELTAFVSEFYHDRQKSGVINKVNKNYILKNSGAVEKTFEAILQNTKGK